MGDIPEDVMAVAADVHDRTKDYTRFAKIHHIALALLAERKRCADVAMKEARDFVEHRMVEVSYGATCAAKAIMAQ